MIQQIKDLLRIHCLSQEIAKYWEEVHRETNLDLDEKHWDGNSLLANFKFFHQLQKQDKDKLLFRTQLKLIAKFKVALAKVNEQLATDPNQSLISGSSNKKVLSLEKQMMVSRQLLGDLRQDYYPVINE